MSVSSDYDSEDPDDSDEVDLALKIGLHESRCQNELTELVNNFASHGDLPWRILTHASDSFVLWSCATGMAFRGPVYSAEKTEKGGVIVLQNASYVNTRVKRNLNALISEARERLLETEKAEFDSEIFQETPEPTSLVGFITEVLKICGMQTTPENVCSFILDVPVWNML